MANYDIDNYPNKFIQWLNPKGYFDVYLPLHSERNIFNSNHPKTKFCKNHTYPCQLGPDH